MIESVKRQTERQRQIEKSFVFNFIMMTKTEHIVE